MPTSYTVPGPTRYDQLLAHGIQAVPPYARSVTRAQEELKGTTSALLGADASISTWIRMSLIATAVGPWLDMHGRDRAMPRRLDEGDDAYRARLPLVEDAVTPTAVLGVAEGLIASAGIAGDVYLKEIWRDVVSCDVGFFDRDRLVGPGPAVVVILPPSTPEDVARSVYEAIRARKAGGVYQLVFPSVTGGQP